MTSRWWWRALGGPNAVSWPVLLIPIAIAFPTTLSSASGWGIPIQTSALGQIVGVALMLGILIFARKSWLQPDRATPPGGLLVVLTFALASGMRLIGMGLVFGLSGVLDQWPVSLSILSGGVGQTIVLCMGAITVNTVRGHAQAMARLESIRRQIEHARALTLEDVQRMQQEVAAEVLASARNLLASVRSDSDVHRVAEAVQRAATDVVRSASHQMHSGQSVAQRIQGPDRPARIRAVITGVRPLAPVFGPVVYEVLLLPAVWGLHGSTVALINLLVGSSVLIAGNLLLRQFWRKRHPRTFRLVWLFVAYSLSNLVALLSVVSVTAAFDYNTTNLVTGFAFYPIAMLTGSVLLRIVERQSDAERDLSRAVEDESREMSRVLQLAEDERRRLARVMHGEVQAELTAAAAKITALQDSDESTTTAVVEELMVRLSGVDLSGSAERRQTLGELWDTWSLAITLDVDVSHEAQELLTEYPELQERIVPIVSEAITNAVRHGDDSEVTVDLDLRDAFVWIEVRNRGVIATGMSGLGTAEIDHFAESWSITQDGPEVVFTATLSSPSPVSH